MLGLWEKRDVAVGTFSKGMKQKLGIACALVHDPKVLFMDEPTANLDPESAKTVRDFILDLKKEKRTIFLNTHNLDEAQKICDKIAILNTKLMAVGTPEGLERSASGRKTVVQLVQVSDPILAALRKLPLGNMVVEGNKLTFDVMDPEKENVAIVDAIYGAGGHVRTVTVVGSTLEEAYLKLVRLDET
jgi:ABC-2 type transport system ATP-binding protein